MAKNELIESQRDGASSKDKIDIQLEIYRQKYEVYRHLDKLRWNVPTISLAAGTVLLTFSGENDSPKWWAFVVFGILLLFSSYAVFRMRKGIAKNHQTLVEFASILGDNSISELKKRGGATWWLAIVMFVGGLAAIIGGIMKLIF